MNSLQSLFTEWLSNIPFPELHQMNRDIQSSKEQALQIKCVITKRQAQYGQTLKLGAGFL